MYVCTQHNGDQECPKGLAPACCYEVCKDEEEEVVSCGAACLRYDQGEGCEWRKAISERGVA